MGDDRLRQTPSVERVKKALLSLGEGLREAEAIGICGSLARGEDFSEESDIDMFVVVREREPGHETDMRWWKRIKKALSEFERDVTVLVYTVKGLRAVSNWYALRLASEGILAFDQGNVAELFREIVKAAEAAGLSQEKIDGSWVWMAKGIKPGKVLEVKLP